MKESIDKYASSESKNSSFTIASKVRDYMMLIKFSLSFMVVFSAVVSYLTGAERLWSSTG